MSAMASAGKCAGSARITASNSRSLPVSARRAVKVHNRRVSTATKPLLRSPTFHQSTGRGMPAVQPLTAAAVDDNVAAQPKEGWWTRDSAENMIEVTSLPQLVEELRKAQDKLVIVDFYAQWCNACRALYPKLCKLCRENPDIVLLKVNWKENKAMCKMLNVKVLPYFHFYRGAEGRVEAFSASISKFSRIRDALAVHGPSRCSLGPSLNIKQVIYDSRQENSSEPGSKNDKEDFKENPARLITAAAKF